MTLHPVEMMWRGASYPDPNWTGKARTARPVPAPRPGTCALTGAHGEVWEARYVISDLFTRFDALPFRQADPLGLAFGPAAAWALRNRKMMQRPHVLSGDRFAEVGPAELYDTLSILPRRPSYLALVPISGQQHVCLSASPGQVATDAGSLSWTRSDASRLYVYASLRRSGFGEKALTEPSPRWSVIKAMSAEGGGQTMELWPLLDEWRHNPAYMDVAARATRKPKETDGDDAVKAGNTGGHGGDLASSRSEG